MRREYILAASSAFSALLGAAGGYMYAKRKFDRTYEEMIAKEIAEAKEFYSNFYKTDYPTPADAVDALIPGEEAVKAATVALRKYAGITVKREDLIQGQSIMGGIVDEMTRPPMEDDEIEVEVEQRNVFDEAVKHEDFWKTSRDTSSPHIVDFDEYMEHPEGHDEIQLTYYAGDKVLGDTDDEPVDGARVDELVGLSNLDFFGVSDPDDPNILLIRNPVKKLDIEITRSDGHFVHEVLGFNHSDEPMRRRRPRWNDE